LAIATSTAPSYPLDVAGSINATTYYGDGSNLTGISAGQWTDAGTYIYANNATNVAVTDGGSVGIGTTSPGQKLAVDGAIDVMTNKIVNLATPTADTDAATKGYVDSSAGGSLICTTVSNTTSFMSEFEGSVTASCATGYLATGGGCDIDEIEQPRRIISKPSGSAGWYCYYENYGYTSFDLTAYVRCCKIE